jgi:hypothetical protein
VTRTWSSPTGTAVVEDIGIWIVPELPLMRHPTAQCAVEVTAYDPSGSDGFV